MLEQGSCHRSERSAKKHGETKLLVILLNSIDLYRISKKHQANTTLDGAECLDNAYLEAGGSDRCMGSRESSKSAGQKAGNSSEGTVVAHHLRSNLFEIGFLAFVLKR